MKRSHAFTLVELLIISGIIILLVTIMVPVFTGVRELVRRNVCRANLNTIGKALGSYAVENDGPMPNFPSTTARWNWVGHHHTSLGEFGVADGTRPLFMLMYYPALDPATGAYVRRKLDLVGSRVFVCPSVRDAQADPMDEADQIGFGASRYISYSYQHSLRPTQGRPLDWALDAGRVIMADKSPLSEFRGTTGQAGGSSYDVLAATTAEATSNSINHEGGGQSVLTLDGAAAWVESPLSGLDEENIWTPDGYAGNASMQTQTASTIRSEDVFLVP